MALGPDFRPAEESNTGGCWRLHTSSQPQPQSGPSKVRGEELSSTIDSVGESASFYEALTGGGELQQLVAAAGWTGVTFAAGVLSNLCRATATTALQLATNRPAAAKPTIRTFRRTFPAPAEEQLCNAVQFFCKTAPSASLARKVHLVRPGPVLLSGEGRGAGLARIVGKQVRSWSNWHGLHQLGGSTRRLLLQAKGKRGSDWRRVLDPNSCDPDTTLESRLWGIE